MYENYIAVDWAQKNMAIARMTQHSNKVSVKDVPAKLEELQLYLKQLKGTKILTFEETTTSQWLYTELRELVDELVVCDPFRNRLLSEGAQTDKIDASCLVQLLRAGLTKPVFHSGDAFIHLRKLVSGYDDVVKAGVRVKNQRAALFRAKGKDLKETELHEPAEKFVLEGLNKGIEEYEKNKIRYEKEFERIVKTNQKIRNLTSIPGIGIIGAVKIAAMIVDARRFSKKGNYLSYCGLVMLEMMSGGRVYGRKRPRYCRTLKSVFKTAAMSAIYTNADKTLRDYYDYLIREKNCSEFNARHAVCRRIAVISYAVLKSGQSYSGDKIKCKS